MLEESLKERLEETEAEATEIVDGLHFVLFLEKFFALKLFFYIFYFFYQIILIYLINPFWIFIV